MVSASPERLEPTCERPSLPSAVPESVRPLLPALMVIAPVDEIDDVPPVTLSIALSRSPTLSPIPMLVPVEVEPATKEKVVPLTTSVSVVVKASDEIRSLDVLLAVPPDNAVLAVIAAVVVLSLFSALPVVEVVEKSSRLLAVAPVMTAEVTLDLVE